MHFWSKGIAPCCLLLLSSVLWSPHIEAAQQLKQHRPPAALDRASIGRLAPARELKLGIGLPLRNREALTNLLLDLYDPASPRFRKFLTPEQFTAEFGPSEQDYRAAADFFKRQGFRVTRTYSNRLLFNVEGSVGTIERTLHVALRQHRHPREARNFFAPDAEPWLDLDVPVLHISGLDDFIVPRPAGLHTEPIDSITPRPVPQGGSGPNGTYMGVDFRAAYAPGVTLRGNGQYVGLVQFDGYYPSDISAYVSRAGLTNVPLLNVLLDHFDGTPGPGNVEVALDIEMCIAMAPGLDGIIVYMGLYPEDILNRMVVDNLAKQLSASWTFSISPTTQTIFQQMAAQGQSYFNACGDSGAYSGAIAEPADSPYITSVGGTTLSTLGPGRAWSSETTWNWASTGSGSMATGGGISVTWPLPTWQQGIDMSLNQGSTSKRNIPDVSMVADNVFIVSDNGQLGSVGGTSVASPLWAAFMALVNQQAAFSGQPPIGFINPPVYALGKGSGYNAGFHDITTGNNTNASSPTRFYAVPGYDLCTGWGTPTGKALIDALAPPLTAPKIVGATASLLLETCNPGNGVIDPLEVVTYSFFLQNVGGLSTTNLTATLLSSNGISPASASQLYGALAAGGGLASRQFTFRATGNCGDTLNPVLQLNDGAVNLGKVTFNLPLGKPAASFAENFDSTPGLPSGWTVARTGGGSNWIVSSVFRDSVPNAVYAYEPTNAGLCELVSPMIPITSSSAQLVFRTYYNTEVSGEDASLAFDGGVLEISIGGGVFRDILTAGGTFASGGYTHTVDTRENPLDRRQVWAGLSGGFKTVTANLPTGSAGQSVQFKWRFGFDNGNAYGGAGWYVDSMALQEGFNCCNASTNADLAITQSVFPSQVRIGQNLAHTFTVTCLGPGPALNVSLTDTLPANASFLSASPGYTNDGGIVSWNLGLMLPGSSTNLLLLVSPSGGDQVTNRAVIASDSFDPNLANNTLTSVTPIVGPPIITVGPSNQVAVAGADVTFTVQASGTPPLAYQWQFNSSPLPGQNASSLLLPTVQIENMGNYVVVVTNLSGAVTSAPPAVLRVLVPPQVAFARADQTNVSLLIDSVQGLNYSLEYKNSLLDPSWAPVVGTVIGTGDRITLWDTNQLPFATRFYRVKTE